MKQELYDELIEKLKTLNETVWEHSIDKRTIQNWLNNFNGDNEKIHALFLVSQFMYFGSRQMRHLLKILFEDKFKYPIIEKIRSQNTDTKDLQIIYNEYETQLKATRFLGIGNPSESGPHLLYYFRQENRLPKHLFIHTHEIFRRYATPKAPELSDSSIRHYVFIDDFCGSGSQAIRYSNALLRDIKKIDKDIKVDYLVLFSTAHGKSEIIRQTVFDNVDSIFELDNTFKCFDPNSRYFKDKPDIIDIDLLKKTCQNYGILLMKSICKMEGAPNHKLDECAKQNCLGFKNGQLLIGFHHNTPDNTLPIIWYDEEEIPWNALFKRYNKNYN